MIEERRVVTVLFSDVAGSTAIASQMDPEDWAEIMAGLFNYLIQPVERYGGNVARLMGDAILAFFGAPIAHEDDPQRAVLAGLDIVNGITPYAAEIKAEFGIDLNVRVGINTGLVVLGEFGAERSFEYTAMGDGINLAARMEQTAEPGTVQITGATYELVAPLFEIESLGRIDVKGKAEPVPAYRVLNRKVEPGRLRGLAGSETPLVGRSSELFKLRTVFEELKIGRSQIVSLIGDAGLGKSRLIDEIRRVWEELAPEYASGTFGYPFNWIGARALSYESDRPYALFIDTVRRHFGIESADENAVIRQKVREQLHDLPPGLRDMNAIAVERILMLSANSRGAIATDEPVSQDNETMIAQLHELMTDTFRQMISGTPTVYVLDDLHWADSASIDLISRLFRLTDETPILFVCAMRPRRDAPSWRLKQVADTDYPHRYLEFTLHALDTTGSGELIDQLIVDAPDDLRDLILGRTDGNPYFVEEVIRSLIDEQILAPAQAEGGRRWRISDQANTLQIRIPNTLQALLLERIDRLTAETQQTLQVASVIGRTFYQRVLAKTIHKPELEQQLSTLLRVELIRESAWLPEREYSFLHALTWEAAYSTILRRQRRAYHRQVAENIEELFQDNTDEQARVLAHHYYQARDLRAVPYLALIGDQAYSLSSYPEAINHYSRAIEIARLGEVETGVLSNCYRRLGRSYEHRSDYLSAVATYEEMMALANERGDQFLELSSLIGQATVYWSGSTVSDLERATAIAQSALELATEIGSKPDEAEVHWILMNLKARESDGKAALNHGEASLAIARELGLKTQLAYTLNDLRAVHMLTGDVARTREELAEAMDLWVELGNRPMQVDNIWSLGILDYSRGNFEEVLALAEQEMELSQTISHNWGIGYAYWLRAWPAYERGLYQQALAAVEQAAHYAEVGENGYSLSAALSILAMIYQDLGQTDTSQRYINRAIKTVADMPEMFQVVSRMIYCDLLLRQGDIEQARKTIEGVEPTEFGYGQVYGNIVPGRLALAMGDGPRACAIADDLLEKKRLIGMRILFPDIYLLRGRGLALTGQHNSARESLETARVAAEDVGTRRLLWDIYRELSKNAGYLGNPEEAERYMAAARTEIDYLAGQLDSAEWRESFLNRPDLREIIQHRSSA